MSGAVSLFPLCALMAWTEKTLSATFISVRNIRSVGLMILKIFLFQTKMTEHQQKH
jgi:hypothetical protein